MTVGRRERKKLATRAALSEAALRLSLEHGVENVTVEQIADSADVSLRTFFNYFSSKEEAVVAGDAVRGEMLVDEFRSRPASESVLTALEAAVVVFVDDLVGSGRREQMRMMRSSTALLPHQLAAYAASERALGVAVAERVGEVVPDDAAPDDPAPDDGEQEERRVGLYPALVAATAMAALRVAVLRWTDGGSEDLDALHAVVGEVFRRLSEGLDKF